jgi:hypothetical protein
MDPNPLLPALDLAIAHLCGGGLLNGGGLLLRAQRVLARNER